MFEYFKKYIDYFNKHYAVQKVSVNGQPKEVKQDSKINAYNIQSYSQELSITLSPQAPNIDTRKNLNEFKEELRCGITSIMNPANYKNGSTLINLSVKKNTRDRECIAKIYYSPKVPVFDNQINSDEELSDYDFVNDNKISN